MSLIIEPDDGVAPVLAAIKRARRSIEIAVFRFDRKDVESALRAAVVRGVRVAALIASANRGGEKTLRQLEQRFLDAGIIVARTADDLVRYHAKYILIDRRVLYVLSFNFTRHDIAQSRGFGIVTSQPACLRDAAALFKADCARIPYTPKKPGAFVVSPANSRPVLGAFLKGARQRLWIYDPGVSDRQMLRRLQERVTAGVEVRVIGQVSGRVPFEVRKLSGLQLHTRTIIRDGHQAFVGSQSLRAAELDSRREVGLIVRDTKIVKRLAGTFESDWKSASAKSLPGGFAARITPVEPADTASPKQVARAVEVFTKELQPLASTVTQAVRKAVAKAGHDVLNDKSVKDTMKDVVRLAVKEAVKDAVQDAQEARPPR